MEHFTFKDFAHDNTQGEKLLINKGRKLNLENP